MTRILGAALLTGLLVQTAPAQDVSTTHKAERPILYAPAVAAPAAEQKTPPIQSTSEEGAAPIRRFAFLPPEEPQPLAAPEIPPPTPEVPALPTPPPVDGPLVTGLPVVLYPHVRVKDPHKVHPLAVPTIIAVPDPRDHRGIVHIEVCVPPRPYDKFKQNRRGTRTEYDFGKYEVDIITRRGVVTIDYDS